MIWSELGISGGTALIVLCALYFVVKWAVRNGIREARERMTGEKKGWLQGACAQLFSAEKPQE